MKSFSYIKLFCVFTIAINAFLFTSCNEGKSNSNSKVSSTVAKNNVANTNVAAPIPVDPDAVFNGEVLKYDTTKKYVYLTFDDGPQGGTKTCFDLCKKLNIKSTFFMVGAHASEPHDKKLVKDIKYDYPRTLLANHSTTHANGRYHYFYAHARMALEDFLLAQKTLEVPYKIIRLPGNTSWVREKTVRIYNKETGAVCKLLDSCGYNVMGWDVEWNFSRRDAHPVESAEKLHKIVNNAFENNKLMEKNHLVILTHDRMFRAPNYTDSLAKFINLLKAHGNYVFETIDHYPNLKKLK